jgi:uncharacterized protein (TIGR03437 family)
VVGTYNTPRLQGRNGSVAREAALNLIIARSGLTAALSAASPVVGVTDVFLAGNAAGGATVTMLERWPDGATTRTRTAAADAAGAYRIGPFKLEQLGTYSATVQDSAGSGQQTLTYSGSGDFETLLAAPRQTAAPGQTVTFAVTFRSAGGFAGEVSLSAQGWTAVQGATGAWAQGSVTVPANGSATASFTIQTSPTTPVGSYPDILLTGRNGSVTRTAAGTLVVSAAGAAPSFEASGVVSAASFLPPVARGMVASLFGAALATRTEVATSVPLPRTLGGVRVTVNGIDVPLWFVSPNQINFQMAFELPLLGMVPVRVIRDGAASEPVNVLLEEYAPGVFTYQRVPGVQDPIAVHADGRLVTPDNPAVAGEVLIVFGTGLGNLTVLPRSGEPSPEAPPAQSQRAPEITLGGVRVEALFAGLTPGSIGLAQFNIKLPEVLPPGTSLPLVIQFGPARSKAVDLAVR